MVDVVEYIFNRDPAWGPKRANERIRSRIATVDKRRGALVSLIETHLAESVELTRFSLDLKSLLELEIGESGGTTLPSGQEGSASQHGGEHCEGCAGPATTAADAGRTAWDPRVVEKRAGQSRGRYDADLCLFVSPDGRRGGSTRPRRFPSSSDLMADPLMARALKIMEVPGLVHAMILSDRSQTVIDLDEIVVPEEALGLPQAEAFQDHVFSSAALTALRDPRTASDFIRKLKRSSDPS